MLGKIFGVATVGTTLAGIGLLHRLLFTLAQIMILVIVSAFLSCASLISLLYIIYFCMLQFGLAANLAGVLTGLMAILVTVLVVAFTFDRFRQLQSFQYRSPHNDNNSWHDVGHIAVAFIDGFLNKKK